MLRQSISVYYFIFLCVKFFKMLIISWHTPKPCLLHTQWPTAPSERSMDIPIKILQNLAFIRENLIYPQKSCFKYSQNSFRIKCFYTLIRRYLSWLLSLFFLSTLIEDLRNLEKSQEKSRNLEKDYFSMIFSPIIMTIDFSMLFYSFSRKVFQDF